MWVTRYCTDMNLTNFHLTLVTYYQSTSFQDLKVIRKTMISSSLTAEHMNTYQSPKLINTTQNCFKREGKGVHGVMIIQSSFVFP